MRPVLRRFPVVVAVAIGLTAGLGLVACSGPEKNGLENATAPDVGDRAVDAFRDADSVHVVGTVGPGGENKGTRYDLRLAGASAMGTIAWDDSEHEIIKVDDETYVRADRKYYEALGEADAASLLAGQWVRLSEKQAGQYRYFTQEGLALAVTEYTASLEGPVATTKLDDAEAVTASSPDGSKLWAANTGDPYPLRLEMSGTDRNDTGTLEFSDYGAEVDIAPPADALDFARLD